MNGCVCILIREYQETRMADIDFESEFKNICFYDDDNKIRFSPPVYEQRYMAVLKILEIELWKKEIKKVVEFGCAEMKFFTLLKSLKYAEHILQIDINEDLLMNSSGYVKPQLCDYVRKKDHPFMVDIYRGSISDPYPCLLEADVVIGIEIIEHLDPQVLENVPRNVFGYVKPKIAIFTTPNSEMNVLFDGLLENGFRHDDHRFEWTREQFEDWGNNICLRYDNYVVKYIGIGPGPENYSQLGCVSQMAIFIRKDIIPMELVEQLEVKQPETIIVQKYEKPVQGDGPYFDEDMGEIVIKRDVEENEMEKNEDDVEDEEQNSSGPLFIGQAAIANVIPEENNNEPLPDDYKHLFHFDFPVETPDERPRSQKIMDAARFQIRRLKNFEEEFYNFDKGVFEISLESILEGVLQETDSIKELKEVLKDNLYKVNEKDFIILPAIESDDECSDDEFFKQEIDFDSPFVEVDDTGTKTIQNDDEEW